MRQSVAIFWAGATMFVLMFLIQGYTWPLYIYVPAVGLLIYSRQKVKKEQQALFEREGFTPSFSHEFDGTEIAVDVTTRRLALNDRGSLKILSGDDIVKCRVGKATTTRRPDMFDKDRKVRETIYQLDVWTRDLETPNFRIHFSSSADQELWRARVNSLMGDD